MHRKAIIFDLDGTLLNTLEDIGDAANRVLAANGLPTHSMEAYRRFVGEGVKMLITRAVPEEKRQEHTIRAFVEAFREDYGRHWNVKTRPYPGIPDLINAAVKRGMKLAVLSNKPHPMTTLCVRELLPHWNFHAVLGQRDGVPRKPNPAGALEIADRLIMQPEEFFYLGDSAVDMKTALAANMFPVGALWGFRSREELKEAGARALIAHPSEMEPLLDQDSQVENRTEPPPFAPA
jgi:phosphoglycolate phosphatase